MLEGQQGFLHADGGELDEVRDARRLGRGEQIHMRLMVDGPGVLRRARPRGHAGDDGVESLSRETVPLQRQSVSHVHMTHAGAGEEGWGRFHRLRALKPHEAGDIVPAIHQNTQSRPSNRAGGPGEGYAHMLILGRVIARNMNLDNLDIFKTQSA